MKLYLRVTETGPEAYSLTQLRRDNPHVSFPDQISAEVLADFGVYEYALQDRPLRARSKLRGPLWAQCPLLRRPHDLCLSLDWVLALQQMPARRHWPDYALS